MARSKISQTTGSYDEWLINSLKNKKSAITYLKVALEEFQKDDDIEAFLIALRQVSEAQGERLK